MIYTDNSGWPYVEADDGTLQRVSPCHEAPLHRGTKLGVRVHYCACGQTVDLYDLEPDISEREHRANANAAD